MNQSPAPLTITPGLPAPSAPFVTATPFRNPSQLVVSPQVQAFPNSHLISHPTPIDTPQKQTIDINLNINISGGGVSVNGSSAQKQQPPASILSGGGGIISNTVRPGIIGAALPNLPVHFSVGNNVSPGPNFNGPNNIPFNQPRVFPPGQVTFTTGRQFIGKSLPPGAIVNFPVQPAISPPAVVMSPPPPVTVGPVPAQQSPTSPAPVPAPAPQTSVHASEIVSPTLIPDIRREESDHSIERKLNDDYEQYSHNMAGGAAQLFGKGLGRQSEVRSVISNPFKPPQQPYLPTPEYIKCILCQKEFDVLEAESHAASHRRQYKPIDVSGLSQLMNAVKPRHTETKPIIEPQEQYINNQVDFYVLEKITKQKVPVGAVRPSVVSGPALGNPRDTSMISQSSASGAPGPTHKPQRAMNAMMINQDLQVQKAVNSSMISNASKVSGAVDESWRRSKVAEGLHVNVNEEAWPDNNMLHLLGSAIQRQVSNMH